MPKVKTAADSYQEGLINLIKSSYTELPTSSAVSNPWLERLNKSLKAWELKDDVKWPQPAYHMGVPTEEYKNVLLGRIKETLVSFSDYIAHSAIFSASEKEASDGSYQKLMSVLETPEPATVIGYSETELKGLFYRDLVHNHRYWKDEGNHIQLMRNLLDIIVPVTELSLGKRLEEKKVDIQTSLGIMFSTKLSSYGVCPGGHNSRIRDAKDQLQVSPEAALLSHWNAYVKRLTIEQSPGEFPLSILNMMPAGEEVHIPPAIDYLVGVPKELVMTKDPDMFNAFENFSLGNHRLLVNKVFDFSKSMTQPLDHEIDTGLKDFDTLPLGKQNVKVNEFVDSILLPFEKGGQADDFKHRLYNDDTKTFHNAKTIKEMTKERLAQRMCTILDINPIPWRELLNLDVSVEQRLECLPKEAHLLTALFLNYAYNNNVTALYTVRDACPDDVKQVMFNRALLDCAVQPDGSILNRVREACPENLKEKMFATTVLDLALNRDIDLISRAIEACPSHLKLKMLGAVTFHCTKWGDIASLKKVLNACPADLRENLYNNLLTHFETRGSRQEMQTIWAVCPENLKPSMYAKSIVECALQGNDNGVITIRNRCPDNLKGQMFLFAISKCVAERDHGIALNTILDACPDDLKGAMFSKAVLESAKQNKPNTLKTVQTNCPNNMKGTIFAMALFNCAMEGDDHALSRLRDAFPDTLRPTAFAEAMLNCALQGNVAALKRLGDTCSENLKVKVFTASISKCAKIGNITLLNRILDIGPKKLKKPSFMMAIVKSLEKDVDIQLNDILSVCPEHIKKETLGLSMLFCVELNKTDALTELSKACPDHLKEEMFSSAITQSAMQGSKETLKHVWNECPADSMEAVFAKTADLCKGKGLGKELNLISSTKNEAKWSRMKVPKRRAGQHKSKVIRNPNKDTEAKVKQPRRNTL